MGIYQSTHGINCAHRPVCSCTQSVYKTGATVSQIWLNQDPYSPTIDDSQEHSLSFFPPIFIIFECSTTSDWLNRIV